MVYYNNRNSWPSSEYSSKLTVSRVLCRPELEKYLEKLKKMRDEETNPRKRKKIEKCIENVYNSLYKSASERLKIEEQRFLQETRQKKSK